MESSIILGSSKKDMQLLMTLAQKIGINARFLSKDALEDIGMAKAIKEGESRELIDIAEFLQSLK